MAQVDFSNAVLEPSNYDDPNTRPFHYGDNIGLNQSAFLYTSEDGSITTGQVKNKLVGTNTKAVIHYAGTFTKSGNYFYLESHYVWKVSNITYNEGDTYSFVVEVEVEGN